jgi:hypothetical protein
MGRTIAAILAGAIAAVCTVFVGEFIGHSIFPPPAGTDLSNPEALKTLIENLPAGAIVAVLVSWAAGAFVGGGIAARLSGKAWTAWLIGALMLAGGIASMLAIPHPTWFMLASLPATIVPAWLAGLLFKRERVR